MKNFVYLLLPLLLFSCKENSSIKKNADLPEEQKNVVENIDTKSTERMLEWWKISTINWF